MTNAQKWVSVFLVLFILLLVLSKITNRQTNKNEPIISENSEPVEILDNKTIVHNLMKNNRCYTCHGKDLNGTGMGPSLANIGNNWNKINLVSYFQNPKAFLSNSRMAVLAEKYKNEMPAQKKMTLEELELVAEFLINKK